MLRTATVKENHNLTEDVFELVLEMDEVFEYKSGQFINVRIQDDGKPCFRAYSIGSRPNGNIMKLCIKLVEGGRGGPWLYSRKAGDKITFLGPSGYFVYKTPPEKTALFIATGTGVAPFVAMIEEELVRNNEQKIELIFGVRHESDLFYQDFFNELAEKYRNFKFTMTLSRPETAEWTGQKGRVTNVLENYELDPANTETYICGLKAMIDDAKAILEKRGMPTDSIHFEQYD